MDAKERLGFIGMGQMGRRMASRLVEAGYPLAVYNRTAEKTKPLAEKRAAVAESPRELAAASEIVLSSLADDRAVEEALLGPDGALDGARPGTVFIEMSTISPKSSRRLFEAAKAKGCPLLDAPVSGSTPQAEEGSLTIFVGGAAETYEYGAPLFNVLGKKHFYLGESGSGATMKLVVNVLLGVGMQAIAEAIALREKSGLHKGALIDVLRETAVISPGHKMKLENARGENYPATFPLRLMLKDYRLILNQAAECSVPMPTTAVSQALCSAEEARGMEEDYSAVIRLMEELSGYEAAAEARHAAIH
ncbi:MAG TPA: NAD(P)-dependent oxidoreductase [Candidatus Manganitrophaceae bacterium]|nr:NAD(P)-dependent oxidoreductase [Candidatus Manganitrophaceae bacterium]